MKPPADIDDCEEMVRIVTTEWDIDEEEILSIIGYIFVVHSNFERDSMDADDYRGILTTAAYREAQRRHSNREKYNTEEKVRELREEIGGILNNKYPNANPETWKAECRARFCEFDYCHTDTKVDQVICPICNQRLWITPA